jgi:two-component system nitrate/nitrite response regulator NarL
MLLIAAKDLALAKACRKVLSPFYRLYEKDVTEWNDLDLCIKKSNIEILVVDLLLFGEHGVMEIQALKEIKPKLHIVILTADFNYREQVSSVLFGAEAYCDSHKDIPLLPKIIQTILTNELWVDRKFVTRLLSEIEDITALRCKETKALDKGIAKMTAREKEIAEWIGKGASNRKIAEVLKISERTVKAHLGVIFRKLGIHDRLQLAIFMNRHHQISAIWHTNK